MSMGERKLPLVYSCSGCSSVAQMANYVALCLDRGGHAEMSCIAGVGGDVPSLVQLAKSGRPVVALDGCPLHCVRNCLVRHGVAPKLHLTLTKLGFKKRFRMEFDEDQAVTVFRGVVAVLEGGPQSELVVACLEDPSAEAVQREMPQMQASR
jgi:uncharacterized metal-binding protein